MRRNETADIDSPGGRVDRVYDVLLQRIERGDLRLGDRLPTEMQMTGEFAVSRTVIREALARLSADGLITSRRGSGSYVTQRPDQERHRSADASVLSAVMRCHEFRIALEGEIAAIAALRVTPTQIEEIEAVQARLAENGGEVDPSAELDLDFHLAIAHATRNVLFADALQALQPQLRRHRSSFGEHALRNLRFELVEHQSIIAALRTADPDGAKAAMRTHLENARLRVLSVGMDAFL